MVWIAGFEPATSCSQSKCSTKLNYIQLYGADNENRTRDFWLEARHFTSKLHLHIYEPLVPAGLRSNPFVKSTWVVAKIGADDRSRTCNLLLTRQPHRLLCYASLFFKQIPNAYCELFFYVCCNTYLSCY